MGKVEYTRIRVAFTMSGHKYFYLGKTSLLWIWFSASFEGKSWCSENYYCIIICFVLIFSEHFVLIMHFSLIHSFIKGKCLG